MRFTDQQSYPLPADRVRKLRIGRWLYLAAIVLDAVALLGELFHNSPSAVRLSVTGTGVILFSLLLREVFKCLHRHESALRHR